MQPQEQGTQSMLKQTIKKGILKLFNIYLFNHDLFIYLQDSLCMAGAFHRD